MARRSSDGRVPWPQRYRTFSARKCGSEHFAHGTLFRGDCRSRAGKPVSSSHPMKILLATDDSDCSVGATHSVANRPWPAGTTFKVLSVEELALPSGQIADSSLASIYPQSLLEELISYAHDRAESAVKTATAILERAGKK